VRRIWPGRPSDRGRFFKEAKQFGIRSLSIELISGSDEGQSFISRRAQGAIIDPAACRELRSLLTTFRRSAAHPLPIRFDKIETLLDARECFAGPDEMGNLNEPADMLCHTGRRGSAPAAIRRPGYGPRPGWHRPPPPPPRW